MDDVYSKYHMQPENLAVIKFGGLVSIAVELKLHVHVAIIPSRLLLVMDILVWGTEISGILIWAYFS